MGARSRCSPLKPSGGRAAAPLVAVAGAAAPLVAPAPRCKRAICASVARDRRLPRKRLPRGLLSAASAGRRRRLR